MAGVLVVYGTRPEAIKLAPIIRELRHWNVETTLCATAQHRSMLDQVGELFGIEPDFDLDLMRPNQSPTQAAARVLSALEPVIERVDPEWLVVQGDTTTAVTAAFAGAYSQVPVAHVEAGLRSGNRLQPFPEELNRILTSSISDLHLAPTPRARASLIKENVDPARIVVTGNTVIDALMWARDAPIEIEATSSLRQIDDTRKLILVTAHRRENFGPGLVEAFGAVATLARDRAESIQVLLPVHPNPNITEVAREILGDLDNVILSDPLNYFELVKALSMAFFVITDSGGLQEEAPALGKPVLVLREVTERPEAVSLGAAKLVGTDAPKIVTAAGDLLDDPTCYEAMSPGVSPYGDGRAAQRTVQAILGEQVDEFTPEAEGL